MKDWRYMELNKISHLPNMGRELLGKYVYFTEKRDGSCMAIWLKLLPLRRRIINRILRKRFDNVPDPCKWEIVTSSRNRKHAEQSIRADFFRSGDNCPVLVYLNDNPYHIVFGELLRFGLSPTRMEKHEKVEFIVFDIFDGKQFLGYQQVHQECYHYGMKCVRLFGEGKLTSTESLLDYRDKMLEICKEEKREGVVLKAFYGNGRPLYAKEKLDTATPRGQPKIEHGRVEYPPLPFSEAIGAVDKAYADLGEAFGDKGKAMPLIAKYIQYEMKKHLCGAPEFSFYKLYCDYCEDHNITIITNITVTKVTKVTEEQPKRKGRWNRIKKFIRRLYSYG